MIRPQSMGFFLGRLSRVDMCEWGPRKVASMPHPQHACERASEVASQRASERDECVPRMVAHSLMCAHACAHTHGHMHVWYEPTLLKQYMPCVCVF